MTAVTRQHQRQRHTVPCRQKGLFYPDYSLHGWGEKGLVCNHQRNADRIHSIILMRIQDLFWRSFFGFFLPDPLSPNEAICIHGASKARMKSDHSQTRLDSAARAVNFNGAWLPGLYIAPCLENLAAGLKLLASSTTSASNLLMQRKCGVGA